MLEKLLGHSSQKIIENITKLEKLEKEDTGLGNVKREYEGKLVKLRSFKFNE